MTIYIALHFNIILTFSHILLHSIDVATAVNVILGAQFLTQIEPNQQRFVVNNRAQIIFHPQWTPELIRNDIGVIQLNTPASLNAFVQPIRRASGTRSFENDAATVR